MFKKYFNGYVIIVLSLLVLLILSSAMNTEKVYALSGEVKGGPSLTDTFTYQGYFEYGGSPANGNFDFRITIWDLETLGTQIATCQALDNIQIQDGLFTFHLVPDIAMSEVFIGAGRWLQVEVRQTGTTTWTTLPRQPITAVPYAWNLRPGAVLNIVGLYASSSTATGVTIRAKHTNDGYAVLAEADGGYPAIRGSNSENGEGIFGYSETGNAIYGATNSTEKSGVVGVQTGYSTGDSTYLAPGGFFGGINGVIGLTKEDGGFGVIGVNIAQSGYAGRFYSAYADGVYIKTNNQDAVGLVVDGGTKNAAVDTDQGTTLLYTEESTEVWFTDYGFGTLSNQFVQITIDPLFAQTVNLEEPYHVFIQAYGDAFLYVTNRTSQSFEVHVSEGTLPVDFSYRIVAKRLGYEDDRLETLEAVSSTSFETMQQPLPEGD